MRKNLLRGVVLGGAVMAGLSVAETAGAQTIQLPVQFERSDNDFRSASQLPLWVNYADCENDVKLTFQSVSFANYATISGLILQVWAGGTACSDVGSRTTTSTGCWLVYSQTPTSSSPMDVTIAARDIVGQDSILTSAPLTVVPHKPGDSACQDQNGAHTSLVLDFMFVDAFGNLTGTDSQWTQTGFDITPPAPPADITVSPGDTRLHMTWGTVTDPNIIQYQVYCTPPPGPVLLPDGGYKTSSFPAAPSLKPESLLGDAASIFLGAGGSSSITTTTLLDGGEIVNPAELAAESCDPTSVLTPGGFPNSKYLCGTAGQTAVNATASGLVDGVGYEAAISAVDQVGNVGRLSANVCSSPEKLIDFFELYRDAGGQGGGLCSISRPGGRSAPPWLLPLAGAFFALGAGRRILRRRS